MQGSAEKIYSPRSEGENNTVCAGVRSFIAKSRLKTSQYKQGF